MQSRSTGSLQRSRDDKSDETNFSDLRREILGTFGGSDEHGTKGGFGGFAASCERKSPIRPDHSHWLPGAYSQKLGGKFAQRFCDATLKYPGTRRDQNPVNQEQGTHWCTNRISNLRSVAGQWQGSGASPAVVREPSRALSALSLIATRVCVSRRSIVQVSRGMSNEAPPQTDEPCYNRRRP